MDTMNDLLICAKAIGYKTSHTQSEAWIYSPNNLRIPYNPLTNDAQKWELLNFYFNERFNQLRKHGVPESAVNIGLIFSSLCSRNGIDIEKVIKAVVAMEESK